ncbi:CRISPR-associated endonuclease Cas2 [Deferribacter autotrophicus]|uniref:CRISPR-associated endoribonuclease Cas2 n=1 Tax=Deferribacter autotrophicus TaxID=500465 RepID=A0A5A8F7X9_9BACT|nr:CRISPR-associated endonuclease Cas2 [Deferribacter autotrophicus]KAA0259298.1 CRISPR-associated endonuclease Cas2 [Deferribacter autotrophicus]
MNKNIKVLGYGGNMYVVAVYDISTITSEGQKRLTKIMKLFRQYLHHTQKSVFEGELSEAKFFALKKAANRLINHETDYVVFYKIANKNNIERETVGIDFDPTDNLI